MCSSFTGLSFCGHVLSLSVFPGRYLEIRHSVNAFHDPPTSTVQRLHRTAQPHTDPVCHCQPAVSSFLPSLATKALQPVTEPSAHGREFSSACAVFVYERDSRTVRSIQSRRLRKHDLDSQMLPTRCSFWHRRATACSAIIENRCVRPSS